MNYKKQQIAMTVKNNREYYLYSNDDGTYTQKTVTVYATKPAVYTYRKFKTIPKKFRRYIKWVITLKALK